MSDNSENPYAAPNFAKPLRLPALQTEDELAGRGARLLAAVLDAGFMAVVIIPLIFALELLAPVVMEETVFSELLVSLLAEVVFLALNGYLLMVAGQTIGKLVMKIQIVDQTTAELLPFLRVYVYRHLWITLLSLITVTLFFSVDTNDRLVGVVSLLDVLFIFGAGRLCFHDRLAHSKVVRCKEARPRFGLSFQPDND